MAQCRKQRSPVSRHFSFRRLQTSGEWRSGRKNPCEAMRPGTRMNANTVLWYQAASSMPTIRRWRLSVFSIAHRRDAVKGCQCLHRHPLTAYRRQHRRPLRLSPLSCAYSLLKCVFRIDKMRNILTKRTLYGFLLLSLQHRT